MNYLRHLCRTDGAYYSAEPNVGEFGVYDLILMHSGANKFQTAKEPVNTTSCMIYLIMFKDFESKKCF